MAEHKPIWGCVQQIPKILRKHLSVPYDPYPVICVITESERERE
jgi:hypothetical protein